MDARDASVMDTSTVPRPRSIVNTHVHLPPNFSAFTSVEDAVRNAAAEGIAVLGASNFHDQRIYARFREVASAAGIVPLYGVEAITVDAVLAAEGIRVNDQENPGRIYVCGKGIDPFTAPSDAARDLIARARAADVERMRTMVPLLRVRFGNAGLDTPLTDESIAEDVADRADVPRDWVVLQERHVAQAFQEALFLTTAPERRPTVLAAAFGGPASVNIDDPLAVQAQIRSRLMKAGRHAFVPESPVSFADAYRLILELDGIPCYPTLADGAVPVCPWEDPPAGLAARILERGFHAAELIPTRNRPEVVDEYVAAFRSAGIIVTGGTEHNTAQRIPLEPRCVDGSLPSQTARDTFWEGTCVIAAHQHLRSEGRPGFVDAHGAPTSGFPDADSRIRWFAALGADLIAARTAVATR